MMMSGVASPERRGLPDLAAFVEFDERLREVATNKDAILAAILAATDRLGRVAARDVPERLWLLGYLGNAERVVGNHDRAVASLEDALALAERIGDQSAAATMRIRLGEAFRCADRLDEAEVILRKALEEARGNALEDFALQHLGKCLADAGRLDEASQYLTQALRLRREKADRALTASTELALEHLRRRQLAE